MRQVAFEDLSHSGELDALMPGMERTNMILLPNEETMRADLDRDDSAVRGGQEVLGEQARPARFLSFGIQSQES